MLPTAVYQKGFRAVRTTENPAMRRNLLKKVFLESFFQRSKTVLEAENHGSRRDKNMLSYELVSILWKEVIQCRVIYAWSLRVVMFFVQHGLTFRRTKTSIL